MVGPLLLSLSLSLSLGRESFLNSDWAKPAFLFFAGPGCNVQLQFLRRITEYKEEGVERQEEEEEEEELLGQGGHSSEEAVVAAAPLVPPP